MKILTWNVTYVTQNHHTQDHHHQVGTEIHPFFTEKEKILGQTLKKATKKNVTLTEDTRVTGVTTGTTAPGGALTITVQTKMKRNVTAAEDIDRITKVMPKNIARDADHHIAQTVQHHDTATDIIHSMKKKDSLNMTHL
jgi:hypothetical protein